MSQANPPINSLILYKERAAVVTQHAKKKIDIRTVDGKSVSVRPKDVQLLHRGPIKNLAGLGNLEGDVQTAWELLAGETTTLEELCELAYGDFTPQSAWSAWLLVQDGLYFGGTPEAIVAHSEADVAAEKESRAAKAAEAAAWAAFVGRIDQKRFVEEDKRYLQEVAAVARGQLAQSRVLKALDKGETAENAHALLLEIGYWDARENPYPDRFNISREQAAADIPTLGDETRRDFTHLVSLAIDDEGSKDPDDALSWENGRLWVHIADAGALILPNSPADIEARNRAANLYLPEGTVHMLPPAVTQQLGLGLQEISPALSFGLTVGAQGQLSEVEIVPSLVRVTRLTYGEAEEKLSEAPFAEIYAASSRFMQRRVANGSVEIELPEVKVNVVDDDILIRPVLPLGSRMMVREAMLMVGEAVAAYAQENGLPMAYTAQEAPEVREAETPTPAGYFALRKKMRRSQQQTTPAPHGGLGLDQYVQATSPLRRYMDLVAHQQLRSHLLGGLPLDHSALTERIGTVQAIIGDNRRAERFSISHWKYVFLQRHPEWQGEGIVVEKRGTRAVILLPELELETEIYVRDEIVENTAVILKLVSVQLASRTAQFTILS